MRFAVVDHTGEVIVSFDSGKQMVEIISGAIANETKLLGFRPKKKARIDAEVKASLTEAVRQLGLEAMRA